MKLTIEERQFLIKKIAAGEAIPDDFQEKLFPTLQKEYELRYGGKMRKEDLLADQDGTFAVPLQIEKTFNGEREIFDDGWKNMIVFGDNLQFLKTIYADKDELIKGKVKGKVKLIYIDPPFGTAEDFGAKSGQIAYQDRKKNADFIEFLRRRLIVAKEILAPDGAIYIHLDQKKVHYIKAIMDEIFGENNFRNEIAWKRTSAHNDTGKYGVNVDFILFYTKSENYIFNAHYEEYSDKHLARFRNKDKDGRAWTDSPLTAKGLQGRGYDYTYKGITGYWRCPPETMERLDKEDKLYYTKKGGLRIKKYLDELKGIPLQALWDDINPMNSQAIEKVNYPTQKPEEFLERVILTSTNEDDLVLDFFGGSGTTAAVCEKLRRKWITCDIGKLSFYTMQKRLLTIQDGKNLFKPSKKYGKKARNFITINTGLYDIEKLKTLEKTKYVDFVLNLFEVTPKIHKISGVQFQGIRKDDYSVLVWDYINEDGTKIDEIYLNNLHDNVGKRIGSRLYIIAPANAVQFIGDFYEIDDVRYYFLKIPYQIINELHKQPFSQMRQPQSKAKINDLENAIGFHFMHQPDVESHFEDGALKITKFKPHLSDQTTGQRFENFETLSMLLWDSNYNGKEFTMSDYRFADDFVHVSVDHTDEEIQENLKIKTHIEVPIKHQGESIFVVYVDIFGNEFKEEIKTL